MRFVIFSDLHCHDWSEYSVDHSRLHHGISVVRRVREYCVNHGIANVLFCGDMFHKRGILYTLPYNLMVEELAKVRAAGIQLFAVPGNHDAADRLAKIHSLQALESAGLLRTVGSEGWANWVIQDDSGEEVHVTAVAYCSEAAELRRRANDALIDRKESFRSGKFTIGLFHHGFRGARVGTSLEYVVKEEADPDEYAKDFVTTYSGHYHAHQEIGTLGNAWYIGSPMEFVRGETSPKGFLVLDTQEAEFERITIDLPRFVKLTRAEIVDEDFDMEAHVKGNFVDVVFDELPMPWESIEDVLRKLGAEGIKACPTRNVRLPKSSRMVIDPTQGDRHLLESYMEFVGVDPSERSDLLRSGLSLLEEATK